MNEYMVGYCIVPYLLKKYYGLLLHFATRTESFCILTLEYGYRYNIGLLYILLPQYMPSTYIGSY